MKKNYRVCLLFFIVSHICNAQAPSEWLYNEYVNHVIVLIDRSGSMKRGNGKLELYSIFNQQLGDLCFKNGSVIPGRKLLDVDKGDFLSITTFSLQGNANIAQDFIRAPERYKQNYNADVFKLFWKTNISNSFEAYFSGNYSGITYSRYMAIANLKNNLANRFAHRTFLVYITDGELNSSNKDPYDEERNLKGAPASIKGFDEANKLYNTIRENFDNQEILTLNSNDHVKIGIEEIVPRMSNFSVQKILDEPPPANQILHLTSKGYRLEYPVVMDTDQRQFEIDSMAYFLINAEKGDTIHGTYLKNSPAVIDLPKTYPHNDKDTLYLGMQFWLKFDDEVYNLHQLNPFGTNEQGRAGLNVSIPVTFEPIRFPLSWGIPGRILYNISALMVGPSQAANANFWRIFGLFALLGSIFLYIWKKWTQINVKGFKLKKME